MARKLNSQERQALELIGSSEVTSCISVDPQGAQIVGVRVPHGMSVEIAEEVMKAILGTAKQAFSQDQRR